MSFDYSSEDREFPCTEDRSLQEQAAAMSSAEIAHQITKDWAESPEVRQVLICEALARVLKCLDYKEELAQIEPWEYDDF